MADKKTTQAASGPPPRKGKAAAAPRAGDEVSTSEFEKLLQLREAHGLKGIAVSGYGMEEDIRRSYDAGFINHLTKPIHMEQLRQVIRHCSTG